MKVADKMTRGPHVAGPDDAIRDAAGAMAQVDTGVPPVGEGARLVGMVTGRDTAVRAVAEGKGPDTKVREVMTPDVQYCFEDEDLNEVARRTGREQVRRSPAMNRDKRLVGILPLGDAAMGEGPRPAHRARRLRPMATLSPTAVAAALAAALAATLAASGAVAQPSASPVPDAIRRAPPEMDRSQPADRSGPPRDRSGGGAVGNGIVDDSTGGGGIPRGVIRPPAGVDPGIRTTVPDPTPNTTPVIPPPGTPGGDPRVRPR